MITLGNIILYFGLNSIIVYLIFSQGYGDIVPINTIEKAFIVLVTMVACGVFGFSINKIGHLILEIGKRENE